MTDDSFNLQKLILDVSLRTRIHSLLITGRSLNRKVCAARNEIFYTLHLRGWSYPEIGSRFKRHHTTIMRGVRTHRKANNL